VAGKIGKPCKEPRCPQIVTGGGSYCESHAHLGKRERFEFTNVDRMTFYSSARWQRIRAMKLSSNPICELCNHRFATQVHHLENARANPARRYDVANLQSVCVWCHAKETQREIIEKRKQTETEK
jgi:5-methylcytosine-specific restriction protein A